MKSKIEKINNMSRDEAVEYLKKIHRSTITGRERTILMEVTEDRIHNLNRDSAMVERSEVDD